MVEQTKNTCEQMFGKRLRELRKENGYMIEQFADMVGISKSTLGSLFRYFEKFSKWVNAWEDYVDLCDEERNQILAAAYKQYVLIRVTEAVKPGLEAYREYNKPWE